MSTTRTRRIHRKTTIKLDVFNYLFVERKRDRLKFVLLEPNGPQEVPASNVAEYNNFMDTVDCSNLKIKPEQIERITRN